MSDHRTASNRKDIDILEVGYATLSGAFHRGRDGVGCIT